MSNLASQRARIAAYTRWARTPDATSATAPARRAFEARFERLVDPEGTLPAETLRILVERERKAYFARLAYASAKARRRRQ